VDGREKYRVSSPTKDFSFFSAKIVEGRINKMSSSRHNHFRDDLLFMITSFPYRS
jgi:hypothetical protein